MTHNNFNQQNETDNRGCLVYFIILIIFGLMFFLFSVTSHGQAKEYILVPDSALKLLPAIKPNVVKTFEIKPNSERVYLLEIDTAANVPLIGKLLVYPKYKYNIVDDSSLPGWNKWSQPKFYKGTFSVAHNATFAPMVFTFIGDELEIVGERYPSHGIMSIQIDNMPPVEIDCYHPAKEEKPHVKYTRKNLPYGSHTVTIKNTGKKNPASTSTDIVIDYFVYRTLNNF